MPKMHLVRKGLVNTRFARGPRWTKPNLFRHYKYLTGIGKGNNAAEYYLRPMSAYVSLHSSNRNWNTVAKTPLIHRIPMRMKRKGKMANIYKYGRGFDDDISDTK